MYSKCSSVGSAHAKTHAKAGLVSIPCSIAQVTLVISSTKYFSLGDCREGAVADEAGWTDTEGSC